MKIDKKEQYTFKRQVGDGQFDYRKETAKKKKQIPEYSNKCKGCGYPVHSSENYCGECMCEDDCGY